MSIIAEIRQSLPGKKTVPLELILGGKWINGNWQDVRLKKIALGDSDIVVYDPEHIGRGIYVTWNPNETKEISLQQPMPTCIEELSVFFEMIRRITEYWHGSLLVDGNRIKIKTFFDTISDMPRFLRLVVQKQLIDPILKDGSKTIVLPSAKWDLVIGRKEAEAFESNPDSFGKWLHEKQIVSAWYANVKVYYVQKTLLAVYGYTNQHSWIFPNEPMLPLGAKHPGTGKPLHSEDVRTVAWIDDQVHEHLRQIPYAEFVNRLPEQKVKYYDGGQFLLEPLTLDEIREITYDAVECGQ